jgi:4-hydroxybenzoate polyprenyltransferase
MVAIGMASAQMHLVDHPLWITELSWMTFLAFTGLTFVCSAAFILNQISDKESDAVNQKLFLVGKHISPERSRSISKILLIAGIVISLIANWFTAILVGCIYVIWGILYNQKPFNWKKKPILGWLANTIIGVILFIMGWSLIMKNNPGSGIVLLDISLFKYMLPYLLCFSSVALLTTVPDMKGDAEMGDQTFPIVFGKTPTMILSLLLICAAFIFALKQPDPLASTAALVSIPFFLFTAIRRMEKDVLRAIRYPIFILNFFTLSVYPWLFVPLVVTYYLSKYYYWHRFDLHYPTFLVEND